MQSPYLHSALVAAIAALALSACDRTTTSDNRTVGQKLDSAVEKTGERVAAATDKVVDKTREIARDAKDTTVTTTHEVRQEVKTGDTGRAMSDTAITASIKTDLIKDPDLSALKIDVDTKDGVVTLNGLADNEAAKQRAEKMASAVKGVKEVRNFLTIKRA
jgi:sugar-specific transcriptional regulator TrmB